MHLGAISNWVRHFRKFCAFSNYRNGVEAEVSYLRNTGMVGS